jgi:F420-non-reducing hydrogenase small subunit
MSKPKVGFYWCASCGGCEEAVVDLAETILDVIELVDIVLWPCAMDFKRQDLEAMADGEMAVCFLNGAIRSSEQREMAKLCRRKSQLLVAFGSCSHTGGIPGLANLYTLDSVLQSSYGDRVFSNVNPDGVLPQAHTRREEGELELPILDQEVKTLDQIAPVDYYLPGCAPPVKLIVEAVTAIVEGKLPPKGAVLAPDVALCSDCPRIDSKPEEPFIAEFKRPHEVLIDPDKCFLAQGLICMGPATRGGCDHACIHGNMPCTGCLGRLSRVRDHGAAALSAVASLVANNDANQVAALMDKIPDPAGTLYRYGVPSSILFKRAEPAAKEGAACPAE